MTSMLGNVFWMWLTFSCVGAALALGTGVRAVRRKQASVVFVAATTVVAWMVGPVAVIFFCAMGMLDYYRECGDKLEKP